MTVLLPASDDFSQLLSVDEPAAPRHFMHKVGYLQRMQRDGDKVGKK
jgi:hypothetical protein